MKEAFSMPLQGWDAVRIVTQIASFQTLHYLILATLVPPFLAIFSDTSSLMFEGGPTQVGMVFDWRQLAGKPTYDWRSPVLSTGPKDWTDPGLDEGIDSTKEEMQIDPAVLVSWNLDNVWLDVGINGSSVQDRVIDHERILRFKQKPSDSSNDASGSSNELSKSPSSGSHTVEEALEHWEYSHSSDNTRSYTLIFTWIITIPLDILLLVYLVRRPTHMLDHALTFHLLNLFITTYYVGSLPRGLKWWLTMLVHTAILVVWSEQLAIKREMGRSIGYNLVGNGDTESNAADTARKGARNVVFDSEQEASTERIELRSM